MWSPTSGLLRSQDLKLSFNLHAVFSRSSRRDTIWLLRGSTTIRFGDGTKCHQYLCCTHLLSFWLFVRFLALRLFHRREGFAVGSLVGDIRLWYSEKPCKQGIESWILPEPSRETKESHSAAWGNGFQELTFMVYSLFRRFCT